MKNTKNRKERRKEQNITEKKTPRKRKKKTSTGASVQLQGASSQAMASSPPTDLAISPSSNDVFLVDSGTDESEQDKHDAEKNSDAWHARMESRKQRFLGTSDRGENELPLAHDDENELPLAHDDESVLQLLPAFEDDDSRSEQEDANAAEGNTSNAAAPLPWSSRLGDTEQDGAELEDLLATSTGPSPSGKKGRFVHSKTELADLTQAEKRSRFAFSALHNEILDFCDLVRPTEEEKALRHRTVAAIRDRVLSIYPQAQVGACHLELCAVVVSLRAGSLNFAWRCAHTRVVVLPLFFCLILDSALFLFHFPAVFVVCFRFRSSVHHSQACTCQTATLMSWYSVPRATERMAARVGTKRKAASESMMLQMSMGPQR